MKRNERVTKIMTAAPETVQVGQKLSDAHKAMTDGGFHHMPVLDGQRLVGILSSTDMLRVSYDYGTDPRQTDAVLDHTMSIERLMQPAPEVLRPDQTVREAVDVFATGRFNSLPVVDGVGNLAGLVTTTDVLRYMQSLYG